MDIKEKIHEMKKTILHLHLDGSLRPNTVQSWLCSEGACGVASVIKEKLMVSKDCQDLNQYLEKFDLPIRLLQTEEHIKQATFELYEDLAKQNVNYAEVRFAPSLHLNKGLSYSQIVESAISGLVEAKNKYPINGNLILCCMRGNDNTEQNLETIKIAKQYLGKGVCAIDLAGAEGLFPTKNFEYIFELAHILNIPFTIHAGESDGPESIKSALKFGAKRIGHGIRCIENKKLMEELKSKKILLEICPTSNLQTQAVTGKYPLEEIYNSGILVSINTDNNTVSNTDIEQEYNLVLENTNLTFDDLIKMNKNAEEAIF